MMVILQKKFHRLDGRAYLLLPADDIQVNGLPIQVTNGQETETI